MNIKIIICFILIICFFPSASFGATEKVWSAKSSGIIRSNQSIVFENYIVKATVLDNTKSSIIVYRDNVLLEKKDFDINEFKKYDNVGITLLGINGEYSWIALSKPEDRDIWISSGQRTLKWGENYSFEDVSIEIEALGKDSVNLTVSRNNTVKTDVFTINSSKNYDNMRIVVKDINRTGLIGIELFEYRIPTFEASIHTDKDEYFPDEKISVSINITGDELLNIASISLDGSTSLQFHPFVFSAIDIAGTRSFHSQISDLPPNSTFTINGKIEVRDIYNNVYFTNVSKEVSVTPNISIVKRVQEETDDEKVLVELSLYNSRSKRTFVYIHDNVTEGKNTAQKDWNIELEPKKSTNVSYFIAPQKPGIYQLASAIAKWDGEISTSKKVRTTVHMPYLNIFKKALNNESMTDVELEIKNIGDRPAIVMVDDNIPADFPLESGSPTWYGYIDSGQSANLRYSLKGNPVSLPPASATYRDIRGTIRQVQSNSIENNNISGTKKVDTTPINASQYEIMVFMLSSFLVISGIIGSMAFTAYLITKIRTRSK
jgi:hypothetical protein